MKILVFYHFSIITINFLYQSIINIVHNKTLNILSFISDKSRVIILAKNKLCGDFNQGTIDNLEDCRSLLNSPYVTSFNKNVSNFKEESPKYQTDYPRGCYIYKNETLYFNPHEKGKRSKSSHPVCKESKKRDMIKLL